MDKEYWEKYYKNTQFQSNPSSFAQWFIEEYVPFGSLLELGCGNGRDSLFFEEKGLDVIAIDQSEIAIESLNAIGSSAHFISGDFTNFELSQKVNNVYSRFTLHSVEEEAASRAIKLVSELMSDGYFAIEVRSVKDPLCGKGELVSKDTWFYNNHKRRFVRKNELLEELVQNGFDIVYEVEADGLAIHKDDDPVVIRVIAQKK